MSESKKKLEKLYTLTGLVDYCNKNYTKKTGSKFTASDIESYIRRGYFPQYTGGRMIIRVREVVHGDRVYKLSPPNENPRRMMRLLKNKPIEIDNK